MKSTTPLRNKLEARLGEIAQRVGRIEHDLRRERDRDSEERAIELENDQVLEGLDEMGRVEVREIRAALARMAAGRLRSRDFGKSDEGTSGSPELEPFLSPADGAAVGRTAGGEDAPCRP